MQGDLLCRIVVETPVNLSARQRELLKELQETMDGEDSKSSPKKNHSLIVCLIDRMKIKKDAAASFFVL